MDSMTAVARRPADRRIVRTRTAISAAFYRLLDRMPYSKITVSALAREANINRKTFYLHYRSVDDLLRFAVRSTVIQMVENMYRDLGHQHSGEQPTAEVALRCLTEQIMRGLTENARRDQNLLRSVPSSVLQDMAIEPLRDLISDLRKRRNAPAIPHLNYLLACYLGCVLTCYREWQQEEYPRTSIDDVITLVCSLFSDKARELL